MINSGAIRTVDLSNTRGYIYHGNNYIKIIILLMLQKCLLYLIKINKNINYTYIRNRGLFMCGIRPLNVMQFWGAPL